MSHLATINHAFVAKFEAERRRVDHDFLAQPYGESLAEALYADAHNQPAPYAAAIHEAQDKALDAAIQAARRMHIMTADQMEAAMRRAGIYMKDGHPVVRGLDIGI